MRTHTKSDAAFAARRIAEHADVSKNAERLTVAEITQCIAWSLLTGATADDVEAAFLQAKRLVEDERMDHYRRHQNARSSLPPA